MVVDLRDTISKGAYSTAHNGVGWTPLMILSLMCEYDAIKVLLEQYNIIHDVKNKNHGNSERDKQAEAEKILYMTSNSGLTALMWVEWMAWILEQDLPPGMEKLDSRMLANAKRIRNEFTQRGATLRRKDVIGLRKLKAAFSDALKKEDNVTCSLLLLNLSNLKVNRPDFDSNTEISHISGGLGDRFDSSNLRAMSGLQVPEFVPADYKPNDGGLESSRVLLLTMDDETSLFAGTQQQYDA